MPVGVGATQTNASAQEPGIRKSEGGANRPSGWILGDPLSPITGPFEYCSGMTESLLKKWFCRSGEDKREQ